MEQEDGRWNDASGNYTSAGKMLHGAGLAQVSVDHGGRDPFGIYNLFAGCFS